MRRISSYRVILSTHVDETLAVARIVRLRFRRRLAELSLAHQRRRKLIRRAVLEQQRRLEDLIEWVKSHRSG